MINARVNELIGGNTDEQHLSALVMQLQVKQLDLNATLEDAAADAVATMPNILRQLERIREDADDLRAKLMGMKVHSTPLLLRFCFCLVFCFVCFAF